MDTRKAFTFFDLEKTGQTSLGVIGEENIFVVISSLITSGDSTRELTRAKLLLFVI